MFITFPYGDNTTTINLEHVTNVVWNKPVAGAAVVTSVFFISGKSIDLQLVPAQIRQLENHLAEYNRRLEGKR
jgi:hypothetical protein